MTKDNNPKRTARRTSRQRRRIPPGAVCITCGENDPVTFDHHHPMGFEHEPDLTSLHCKNCHEKATEGQHREEVPLETAPDFLSRIAAIYDALAAFFRFLADSLNRLAEQVRVFAGNLGTVDSEVGDAVEEGD